MLKDVIEIKKKHRLKKKRERKKKNIISTNSIL
jgi:hypothetical protein